MGVRFLLCTLVVFTHNRINSVNIKDKVIILDVPIAIEIIRLFISEYLARIAVPLFFFISSYLLFKKSDPYPLLIKKKIRSLAVPYILWITLFILLRFTAQQIPFLKQYYGTLVLSELDLKGFVSLYIYVDADFHPYVSQLYFVRDLFVCTVFSPLIKQLFKRLPLFSTVAVLLLWQSNLLYYGIRQSIFWFSLGFLAARFDLTYKNIERIRFFDIGVLYALIVTLQFYFYFSTQKAIASLGLLNILIGGVLLLKVSGCICKSEKVYSTLKYLAGFSFWIYATHVDLITAIKKIWIDFLPFNGVGLFAEYFGGTALCVALCLGTGLLLKRIAPKVYLLFTGGRV